MGACSAHFGPPPQVDIQERPQQMPEPVVSIKIASDPPEAPLSAGNESIPLIGQAAETQQPPTPQDNLERTEEHKETPAVETETAEGGTEDGQEGASESLKCAECWHIRIGHNQAPTPTYLFIFHRLKKLGVILPLNLCNPNGKPGIVFRTAEGTQFALDFDGPIEMCFPLQPGKKVTELHGTVPGRFGEFRIKPVDDGLHISVSTQTTAFKLMPHTLAWGDKVLTECKA